MSRPKSTFEKSKEKFPINWFDEIISEYSEGASDVEIKAMIWKWRESFSNDLWDRWMNEEPEFSETIKNGRLLSEAWWKKTGRKNLGTKDFSYTGWYMNMKNRFGWADKVQNDNKNESSLNITISKDLGSKLDDLIENE